MRHPDGNSELMSQMQFHFQAISYNATSNRAQTQLFQQWIYLTQASFLGSTCITIPATAKEVLIPKSISGPKYSEEIFRR